MMHINVGDKSTLTVPGDGLLQLPVHVRTHCVVETTVERALRCTVMGVPLGPDANVGYTGLNKALNLRSAVCTIPASRERPLSAFAFW